MKPPKCRLCGHEHWNREPHKWDQKIDMAKVREAITAPHRKAGKEWFDKVMYEALSATNKSQATNKVNDATNRVDVVDDRKGKPGTVLPDRGASHSGQASGGVGKRTANRRSRDVYNAYQREYMKRRREMSKSAPPEKGTLG